MDDFERQARLNKLNAMIERSRERMENAKKAMQALDAALNATSQLEMENAVADMDVAFIIQAVQDSDRPKLATKDLKSIMIQRFLTFLKQQDAEFLRARGIDPSFLEG